MNKIKFFELPGNVERPLWKTENEGAVTPQETQSNITKRNGTVKINS
jgi:hypothetical protein